MAKGKKGLLKWLGVGFSCVFIVFFGFLAIITGRMPVLFGSGDLNKNKGDNNGAGETVTQSGGGQNGPVVDGDGVPLSPEYTIGVTIYTLEMKVGDKKTDLLLNPKNLEITIECDETIIQVTKKPFIVTAIGAGSCTLTITASGIAKPLVVQITVTGGDDEPQSMYALKYDFVPFSSDGVYWQYNLTFYVSKDGEKTDTEVFGIIVSHEHGDDIEITSNHGNKITFVTNKETFSIKFTLLIDEGILSTTFSKP